MAQFPRRPKFNPPLSEFWHLIGYRYFSTHTKIEGTAREICEAVVEQCWNGTFYRTSTGNFDYFWIRDFAAVSESLCALGHTDRVIATLKWALGHYMKRGAITLCITPNGRLFNAPTSGIDTLPWLIHAIWAAGYELNADEHEFLVRKLEEYREDFIDPNTGHLLSRIGFAELRDSVLYDRSAYSVALVGHMAKCCEQLGLGEAFPHSSAVYQDVLQTHYWNGHHFSADYTNQSFSAESALIPFALGLIDDAEKLAGTLDYIRDHQLASPHPMKYTDTPGRFHYRLWAKTIMRNYAGDTIWTWHGAYYLRLLRSQKHPDTETQEKSFATMIEHHQTFPELLNPDGTLYESLIYKSSEGMIWAALYVDK